VSCRVYAHTVYGDDSRQTDATARDSPRRDRPRRPMPASAHADDDAPPTLDVDVDAILTQLCDEFKSRHGREATAEEMKQWQQQLVEAMAEGGLDI